MENRIESFPPIAEADARLLILGSIPSVESLRQSFYYAHPRNAFWPIMAEILGSASLQTDEDKARLLIRHGIALWDVAHSCVRPGSLDSAIRDPQPNDFDSLFRNCPDIKHIFFNGATAHQLYCKLVAREDARHSYHRMPSTSPAYTLKYEIKRELWRQALKEAFPNEPL